MFVCRRVCVSIIIILFFFLVFLLVGCKAGSYVAQAALKLVIWANADLKLLRFLPPSPKLLNRDALVGLL